MAEWSIVEYFGPNEDGYSCGYCKGQKPESADYGMWAHRLTCTNYQNLIDRGWRRSGKYCYKPILHKTCCPAYTIKCDALNFRLSKSKKRVLKKMFRFLAFDEKEKPKFLESSISSMDFAEACHQPAPEVQSILSSKFQTKKCKTEDNIKKTVTAFDKPDWLAKGIQLTQYKKTKAKARRQQRRIAKIMEKEKCDEATAKVIIIDRLSKKKKPNIEKQLEEFLNEERTFPNPAHTLEIKFVSTSTDEFLETFKLGHEVYKKYQIEIHKDDEDKLTVKQYQRFLIETPLIAETFYGPSSSSALPTHFGSFHMQYWLDKTKLIAVGVIDIMPNSVSSVYLYYDPTYHFLSLGTYSALQEIVLTRKLNTILPGLRFYYMGYYIHSCKKMIYKGKFKPAELLCPESFTWHKIEDCLVRLDKTSYSRFAEPTVLDVDGMNISPSEIMILHQRSILPFSKFSEKTKEKNEKQVKEYAALVGRHCASDMLLYRS